MALAQVEPDADKEQVTSPVGEEVAVDLIPEVVSPVVEEALAATVEILAEERIE